MRRHPYLYYHDCPSLIYLGRYGTLQIGTPGGLSKRASGPYVTTSKLGRFGYAADPCMKHFVVLIPIRNAATIVVATAASPQALFVFQYQNPDVLIVESSTLRILCPRVLPSPTIPVRLRALRPSCGIQ